MSDPDLESSLRALHWRSPPPAFLQRSLEAALRENEAASRRAPLLALLPAPVRWSLAACWVLSLFFWWTTPDPVPATTRSALAHLPPANPEMMVAQTTERQRVTDELVRELSRSLHDSEPRRLP